MKNMYDTADVITLGPAQTSIQGDKLSGQVDNCGDQHFRGDCSDVETAEE